MLEWLNNICTVIGDAILGWSLSLPRDVVVLVVAVLTGLILTVVRVFTTNQNWLKRCQQDKKRLKALIREAKARGDKQAVRRHKDTIQLIGMKSFKCEGMPLLVSLIPIAIIATWAFNRLAFMAPQGGQAVTLTVDFPAYADGDTVLLVPQEGMACDGNAWKQQIQKAKQPFDSYGRLPAPLWPILHRADADPNNVEPTEVHRATWKVTCQKREKPYPLLFRFRGETLDHELIVDGTKYFSPIGGWGEADPATGVYPFSLRANVPEYKFLGFIPSVDLYWNKGVFLPMDAWILAYLIIVIPLSLILKPIMRIA